MNILNTCDALVFVHADYLEQRNIPNKNYFSNLEQATKKMLDDNKPIFSYPSYRQELPQFLNDNWQTIPSQNYYKFFSQTAFYLSQEINKKPSEIALAGGGIFAQECVYRALSNWCNRVYLKFDKIDTDYSYQKLKKGIIITELTELI